MTAEAQAGPRLVPDVGADWRTLAAAFASAPVPFGLWDASGILLGTNSALDALTRAPATRDPLRILVDGETALRRVLAGEAVVLRAQWLTPRESQAQERAAESRALAGELFPVRDAQGGVRYVTGIFRDAGEELRLSAELARLREAEQRLHVTIDNAPITLVSMDAEGRYTCVEGQRLRAMNVRGQDLIGVSAFDLTHDQPHVQAALRRGLSGEACTFRGQSRAGGTYESRVVPQFGADGKVLGLTAVSYDVTEQEKAEQALRLSEENLLRALRAGRLATFEIDFTRGTALVSPNAAEILGASLEQLQDLSSALALIHPDDQEKARRSLRLAVDHGTSIPDIQYRVVRPDNGEVVWFERRLRFKRDPQGKVIGASALMIDISERKRAEEMDARAAELLLENRRMETASKLKSEFLANMSHELRTPLNAILGFAELLHDGHVREGSVHYREFLRDMLRSGQHLLRLVNDVLDLAKVEAGKQDFHPERVQLPELVSDVCAALEPNATRKHIQLMRELDTSLGEVTLDPARFKQVLFNYLSNALKFTPEGGTVVVRTAAESERMFRLEVEDNGIGIAKHDVPRLFSEFQQLETGAGKKHQGTGLGLLLTRRLVEAQGGSVSVRSEPGSGSTFVARLPRTPASNGAEA